MINGREIIKNPLFKIIGECGDELKSKVFVIGGWVRDYVLNIEKEEIEFDIVSATIS